MPQQPILGVPSALVLLEGSSAVIHIMGDASDAVKLSPGSKGPIALTCTYSDGLPKTSITGECLAKNLKSVSVKIVNTAGVPEDAELQMGSERVSLITMPRRPPSRAPPNEVSWIEPGTGRSSASNLSACINKQKTYVAFTGNVGKLVCGPPLTCAWIEDGPDSKKVENPSEVRDPGGSIAGIVSIQVADDVVAGSGTTVVCLGSAQECSLHGRLLLVRWSSDKSGGCP